MHSGLPLTLSAFVSMAILVIGILYIAAPARIVGGFGLPVPPSDRATHAWLRTKGVRDIASGLAVLLCMATTSDRTVGIVVLALAIIPLGDMLNVILSGGSWVTALSVHGITCLVIIFAGLLLVKAV